VPLRLHDKDGYNPLHPAVLRLVQFAVEAAARRDIPVSICGEIAGDPRYAALLLVSACASCRCRRATSAGEAAHPSLDMVPLAARPRHHGPIRFGRIAALLDDFNATARAR